MDYAPIIILIIMAAAVVFALMVLTHLVGPKRPFTEKLTPYESGITPKDTLQKNFSIKYYRIGILFILFDLEIVFFYPWAISLKKLGSYGLLAMSVFSVLLLVGFIYEWKKGALEWKS